MMKPKLLALELWGLGDLALATPFLREAARRYEVTLLARPAASELAPRFWPEVRVIPFAFPWTAFRGKYRLHTWPWAGLNKLVKELRVGAFDAAVSARRDPRDHLLMRLAGAKERVGFPRAGSWTLLTQPVDSPTGPVHRHEAWRLAGEQLGFQIPRHRDFKLTFSRAGGLIVIHTGAAQPVRVWPLERFARLAGRLRLAGHEVKILCDAGQKSALLALGETDAAAPGNVPNLLSLLERAALFIGNDSGPGHLAALAGVPTFTIFGPQLPGLFAPVHPGSEWVEGAPCPHKPCFDACRFESPHCILDVDEADVERRVMRFVRANLAVPA